MTGTRQKWSRGEDVAKFSAEQVADVMAIKQVIYEWGDELDVREGLAMIETDVLTEDCQYFVGGEWRDGRAEAAKFYSDRYERLKEADAVPLMRHFITNLKVSFTSEAHVKADFLLLFFAKVGEAPLMECDPLASADVWMECSRDAGGDWRISRFDSKQTFIRG